MKTEHNYDKEGYHEEVIGGKIVMVKDKHEHIWQLHPHGFSEGIHGGHYATFICQCGAIKEVLLKKVKK